MHRQLPSCRLCGRVSIKNLTLVVMLILLMFLISYSNNEMTNQYIYRGNLHRMKGVEARNDFTVDDVKFKAKLDIPGSFLEKKRIFHDDFPKELVKKVEYKDVNKKAGAWNDDMKHDVKSKEEKSKPLRVDPVIVMPKKEMNDNEHAQKTDEPKPGAHILTQKDTVQTQKEPVRTREKHVEIQKDPIQTEKGHVQTYDAHVHIKEVHDKDKADKAKPDEGTNERHDHDKARANARARASAKVKESKLDLLKKANPDLTDRGVRKFEILGRTDMFDEDRTCKQQLPDALIIGVMKAGTEAFSTYLTINPDVAMSVNVRSTLFFTRNYNKGLDWYKRQMTCSTSRQVTVEKAPQYFSEPHVPSRIHAMNKHIKLILLVRDPIDRAISHYLQVKSAHPKVIGGRSFEDLVFTKHNQVREGIGFIAMSRYSEILQRWYKYFSSQQILVLDGDMFKKDQIKVLSKAEHFLGIKNYITSDRFIFDQQKGFYCLNVNGESVCLGDGKGRTHPELKDVHYQKLKAYFKPYNHALYKMTGKNFHWE